MLLQFSDIALVLAPALALVSSACDPNPATRLPENPQATGGAVTLPAGVEGKVIGAEGPEANAQVCAWRRAPGVDSAQTKQAPRCTTTDAVGEYRLGLEPGEYVLVGAATRHESSRVAVVLDQSRPVARIELRLDPGGGRFTGQVLHTNGEPVVGARITARVDADCTRVIGAITQTGARGGFELWARADAQLDVQAPGFAEGFVIHHPARGDYVLVPESAIWGRVVDARDQPVVGAHVMTTASADLGATLRYASDAIDAIVTDARGEFRVGGLLAGEHQLVAFDDEVMGVSERLRVAYANGETDVEIKLDRLLPREDDPEFGARLRATVVDARGVPVVGQCMRLTPRLAANSPSALASHAWRTDSSGQVEFQNLRPGDYEIEADAPLGREVEVQLEAGTKNATHLTLPASGSLVVEASTAGPGRRVHVHACPGDWRSVAAVTGSGRAVFEHVPPGEIRVALDYPIDCGHDHGERVSVAEGETAEFTLSRPRSAGVAEVSVHVRTANRNRASDAVVYVTEEPRMDLASFDWGRADPARFQVTGASGHVLMHVPGLEVRATVFAFRPYEAGSARLELEQSGRHSAWVRMQRVR